jgi:protein-S-isoprenylcysteine O-methyltransferase Ste14
MDFELVFKIVLITTYSVFSIIRIEYYRLVKKAGYRTITMESKGYSLLLSILICYEVATFFIYTFGPQWLAWATVPMPVWLRWTGAALAAIALLAFIWIHRSLGSNFSAFLKMKDQQTLVISGPYRWIRHPMYTTFYLLHIAAFLLTSNWFIGMTWTIGLTIVIALRIQREELMMMERFGDRYRLYMENTSRFIPSLRLNILSRKKTNML